MFCYLPGHKIGKAMSVSHRMPYDQKNGVVNPNFHLHAHVHDHFECQYLFK